MVTTLLIICTLLYAILDKPHLLQKPIKAEKIIILSTLVLTAILSFVKERTNEKQQDHSSQIIDSLQGSSKALLIQIDTLKKDNKLASREYIDGLMNYHASTTELLAKYGLKVDLLKKTVEHFDTSGRREITPTLLIREAKILGTSDRTIAFDLKAYNSEVHIVDYSYAIIETKPGNGDYIADTFYVIQGTSMNLTTVIPVEGIYQAMLFIDRKPIKAGSYVGIEVTYKSKGNISQKPLRKIYWLDENKSTVREVSNSTYKQVNDYLKTVKIWTPIND